MIHNDASNDMVLVNSNSPKKMKTKDVYKTMDSSQVLAACSQAASSDSQKSLQSLHQGLHTHDESQLYPMVGSPWVSVQREGFATVSDVMVGHLHAPARPPVRPPIMLERRWWPR
jgi:hypothetical protein